MSELMDQDIVRAVSEYVEEATAAKKTRMDLNQQNFEAYHLKQDYSHKRKGQSKEFMAKQSMAVEQISSFMEQGLIDVGQFFKVDPRPGNENPILSVDEISRLTKSQVDKSKFHSYVADSIKLGLLGSLMIAKVHGEFVSVPEYFVDSEEDPDEVESPEEPKKRITRKDKQHWQLKMDLIRQEDYFPDPTGQKLYEIQRSEMDLYRVVKMAEMNPHIYDLEAVRGLQSFVEGIDRQKQAQETNQDNTHAVDHRRRTVTLHEFYGNILDSEGRIVHENCVCTVANDQFLIRKPTRNPFWHGKSPFVVAPLVRVPGSVWHKALMDAPTGHNRALNEIYNLLVDAGMMSVHGIKQLREHWMDNPAQANDGFTAGDTVLANTSCPPGQKVLERVDSGTLSSEALSVMQVMEKEFQQSALVNDLRLGTLPDRSVKATEIVASSQSISGVFSGIARIVEADFIEPILDLSWLTIAQHMKRLDPFELESVLGKERSVQIRELSPEDIFARTVNGHLFKVFGISLTLNKSNDFRKLTALLQTLGGSEVLASEFQKTYSFNKLLGEIVKALDVNEEKIKNDEQQPVQDGSAEQSLSQLFSLQDASPDVQSQIPQAAAGSELTPTGPRPDISGLNTGLTTPG